MPIRSIDDLRKQVGPDWNDVSDEDLISSYARSIEADPAAVAYKLGFGLEEGGKNSKRLSSSIDRYQAGLYGVGEELTKAVGLDTASEWLGKQRRSNELRADTDALRAQQLGAVDSYKQVKDFSTGVDYAVGLGIQSVPYLAEAALGGLAARTAMGGTRAAIEAATLAGDVAVAAKAKRALNIGSTAGATAASYPSSVGDILSNQREQAGQTDPLSAFALGVPYALANAVGVEGAAARGSLFRNTINLLDDAKGLTGGLARTAATGVTTGLKEGASETFQEGMNQLGRMAVDPTESFLSDAAQERFKESFIGGAVLGGGTASALGGWRRSQPTNDIQQVFQDTDTGTTPAPAVTQTVAPATVAPTPAAPVVAGGTSDIAQATQAAQNDQAVADQALQQQAAREQVYEQFGIANPEDPTKGQFFGQKLFGPAVNQVADAMVAATQKMPPIQQELARAVTFANAETGNQLVKFAFNAADPAKSVAKALEAVGKVLTKFQIGHVQSAEEAAQILNTLSENAKGQQLEQINAMHFALTGENTSGFEAAQTITPKKGAKDGKLQMQNPAGVGTVREQGPAGSPAQGNAGDVQPGGVQPINAGSVPEGSLGLQTGQLPGEGVRPGTGGAPVSGDGSVVAQAPQVTTEVQNGQQAPETQAVGTGEAGGTAAAATQAASDQAGGPGVSAVAERGAAGPRVYDPTIAYYATDLSHIPADRRREIRDNILQQALAPTQERSNTLSLKQRMEMVLGALINQDTQEQIAADIKSKPETVSKALNRLGIVMVPRLSAAQQAEKASLEARLGISPETAAELAKLKKADREKQRSAAVTADLPVDEISKALARLNELESSASKSYSAVEFAGTLLEIAANYRSAEFPDGIGPGEFAFLYHAERKVSTKDTAQDERARELENVTNEQLSDAGFGTVKTGGGSQGSVESEDKAFFDRVEKLTKAMANAKGEEERAAAQKELEAEWAKYGKKQKKRSTQSVAKEFGYDEEAAADAEAAAPDMTEEERAAEAWAELAPKDAPAFDEMPDEARTLFINAGEEAWSKKTVEAVLDKYADEVSYAKPEPKKESKRAIQKQSSGKVDVRQQAGDGKAVGEGNFKPQEPAGEGEAKGEVAIRTPKEQYEALTKDIPGMPTFEQLPRNLQQQVIDQAHAGGLTLASLATMGQAAKFEAKVPYPTPFKGQPAYLEAAQRAVVDYMNGDLTKDELIAEFAKQGLTEAQMRSVTNRISDDQYGWVASDMWAVLRAQGKPHKDDVQQSKVERKGTTFTEPEYLEDSLLSFVNRNALGNSVFVVEGLESLRDTGEFADMSEREYSAFLANNNIDEGTQAFVSKASGKAYLIANNIEIGKERGVFMHEVGVHLGMQSKLPQALFDRLVGKVQAWAAANDGSLESRLAAAAMARAVGANVNTAQRRRELVAYFVEEAVNAGVNPTAYEKIQSAGLREWMRSLWAAFKNAVRMLRGLNIDKMTGQDVVDLAYGFAQMETAGRFHGANVKFRRFSTKFMGTGVGGQAYGWGLYFAQARPTAETYAAIEDDKEASFVGTPESRLYHVDLAINDDEWLEWGKPLGKQSALVRAALKKLDLYPSDDQMFDRPFLRNVIEKKAGSEKAASEMLDAAGIKGTKYRDATSADPSYNLVVFNARNVIRVGDQRGVQTNPNDRMAQPEFDWDEIQQSRSTVIGRMPKQLQKPVELTWKTLFKNAALPLMITEDVVKLASKYMKSAADYLQAQYKRQATRLDIELQVERMLQRFDKLPKHIQKLANEFIYDSTMQQKWGYYPGEHRVGTNLFEVDPDFEKRFDAMPAEAQALVRDVFEHGFQMLKLKQAAVDTAIDREFAAREAAAMGDQKELDEIAKEKRAMQKREMALRNLQVDKPYAYLGRHGDYVVVAKSKEFIAAEEIAKGERSSVSGDSVFGDPQQAKNWLQENVSNPEHYVVQFAETQGEADKIAAELAATGKYDVQPEDAGIKEANASYAGGDAFLAVKRLRNMLDRQGSEADPALEKMIGDLYLATVAEASARKSELQRKFVSGADKNMMRNLATAGRADAHFISTALHNDEVVDSLERMRAEARGNRREAMPIYNELYARYSKGMEYKTAGPLAKGLTQLSTVYYLSTSPAFYLQQLLQTNVLSLPYMSGRLGYFRSARAIQAAYKDMQKLVKGLGVNDHVDFDKAPSDVKGMLQALVGMGKIDIGIDSDAKARSGEHTVLDRVMMKIQGVNTRIETINRATAAIAAYRGYLQRYGMDKTIEATKFAADVVSNTHGSYDAFNTPRALNSDFGRVALQFKRFQIIQLSMLGKLFHNAFKGASKEERSVARRALSFMTAHMAVLGGALGVPFVSQMGNILMNIFGDDDEPKDLEQKLRELIGDKDVADLLLRGAPSAVGLESLGKKLAMENVASILPFTDVDLSSRSGMEKVLVGLMGPTAGLALKMADGYGLMRQGDYYKGLEQMLPTGVANVMKGARMASEGVTMRNGDTVLGPADMSMVDAAFQAVGLPTDTITDRQRIQRVVASTDQFYEDRAKEVKNDYARAFKKGDSGAMQDAREAWMELQDARSRNGYTRQPLSTLFRAPMEQAKRERNTAGGVEFNKNNRRFVESLSQ